VDGLSLKEVGDEVGLSAAGVRKRLRGLKMRVMERVEQQDAKREAP
jgi:predicted ArsR family transcriptional regulator